MSDSSEDEDLSRFKDAIDSTFTKLIDESRGKLSTVEKTVSSNSKSERYLEEASHYNDVKVPEEMQKRISAKVSSIISKNVEFVHIQGTESKKIKIKGGVKLFSDSVGFLSCEEVADTYTSKHNKEARKMCRKRKQIECDILNENEKIRAAVITGEYVQSKKEIKLWKSRRKEKLFKYKANGKVLTAVDYS